MTDGKIQGLRAAGVGCLSPGALGHAVVTPAPATSYRACGSPAHGLPTPFASGIRLLPPGLAGPGCDNDSVQARTTKAIADAPGCAMPKPVGPGRPSTKVMTMKRDIEFTTENGTVLCGFLTRRWAVARQELLWHMVLAE